MCIRDSFYEAYKSWAEPKKDYVVKFLAAEYAMDKVGAREALFGNEPKMDDPVTLYEPDDYTNTPKAKPKSPWGIAASKDGRVRVTSKDNDKDGKRDWGKSRDWGRERDWNKKSEQKKSGGLREELDWDKRDYKKPGYKRGKGKGRKR